MEIGKLIEFRNKLYVFIEWKVRNATMPQGQRTAFERLAKIIRTGGAVAVVIIAEHDVPSERTVSGGAAMCREWFGQKDGQTMWHPISGITVGEFVDGLVSRSVVELKARSWAHVDDDGAWNAFGTPKEVL